MALIPANPRGITEPAAVQHLTLTTGDTLAFKPTVSQVLYLVNTTAGSVNVIIDGNGGTTIKPKGYGGSVDVSAGKTIAVPAGLIRMVDLQSISAFCQGVVTVTGAGVTAFIVEG